MIKLSHRPLTAAALTWFAGTAAYAQQDAPQGSTGEEMQQREQEQEQRQVPTQPSPDEGKQGMEPGQQRTEPSQEVKEGTGTEGKRQRAKQASQAASKAANQMRADSVNLSALEAEQVKALQQKLQEHGFYEGQIDGQVGSNTKRALRKFYSQQAQLASAGRILPASAETLGLDQGEVERVRGREAPQREQLRGTQQREQTKPDEQSEQQSTPETREPQEMQQPEGEQGQPQQSGEQDRPME